MAAIDLFDSPSGDDSDADDLSTIKINEDYARRLEHNKRREALHRLEDLKKRGLVDDSDSDDEEESSEDEDDNVDLTKLGTNDVKFLETLVRVKKQDPSVLQQDAKIYSSDEDSGENEQKPKAAKKDRPLYLKDVNARHLIEEGPELGEKSLKYDSKVYNKDQADAIKAFLAAEKEAFAAAADDDEDILKEKGNAVEEKEEDRDAHLVDQNLNEYFGNDDELSENEKFLKEYLRNKMWIDKDADKKPASTDILEVSDDDEELEKQERYEAEYNFRHEQGEGDRVLGHSRIVEGSVRKKTTSRKAQRKSKEERMLQAELERKEELKHLKNLKKKEIQEKLQKIRTIAGIGEDGDITLDEDDLEEDFDPEEYDKKMKKVFGNDYYEAEDADPGFASGDEMDLEKPDFDKEDELLGLPKGWDVGVPNEGFKAAREKFLTLREKEGEEEKEDDDEEKKYEAPVEDKRKRKRKISLKEKVALDKELEEYYKLDYEDTIGDLKTRFKYRSVPANTYGLRTEEILTANEKDLNQYVSLKRLAPYREKEWEVTYHLRKKKDLILHGEKSEGKSDRKKHKPKEHPSASEREGKQNDMKKHKPKEHLSASETEVKQLTETDQSNAEEKKLSRRERRKQRRAEIKVPLSRLEAYGIVPPKTAKKH